MERRPIPPIAWLLTAGTGIALVVLAASTLHIHGTDGFFERAHDSVFYRYTAQSPFGTGHAFIRSGNADEIPYRYGRIGLPIVSWLLAFGQGSLVAWTLIAINTFSIAAVPGLSAALANEYDAPPIAGAAVFLTSILFIRNVIYAEALLTACILLAYLLEARHHRKSALAAFAFAILVKETAILALAPWVYQALRRRDYRRAGAYAAAIVPYALWCVWVRVRVGEFPFLAHTISRSKAIGPPLAGLHYVLVHHTTEYANVVTAVLLTVVACAVGAFVARDLPIGIFTALLAVLFLCLGPNALRYSAEALRLLILPQVFAVLCIAVAIGRRWWPNPAPTDQPVASSSGAKN